MTTTYTSFEESADKKCLDNCPDQKDSSFVVKNTKPMLGDEKNSSYEKYTRAERLSETVADEKKCMDKQYHIVQIGCGVVGYAYVDAYKAKGCKVTGIEASTKLIDEYKKNMDIFHIHASKDIESINNVDFVMISVCTPLKGTKLDMTYLIDTIPNVTTMLRSSPDAIVIIRSTVPPTTTKTYQKLLEASCGRSVNIAFQPEFLRAVSAKEDALNPWHVVVGIDKNTDKSAEIETRLIDLYSKFVPKDKFSIHTIEEAELLKMFHNCFNAAKISWFNQCSMLCDRVNEKHNTKIDINAITSTLVKTCEGLKNAQYGTKTGHAYYGTCLPKDSAELSSLESAYDLPVPLFKSVVQVNNEVKKKDKAEVLVGDFHMPCKQFVK